MMDTVLELVERSNQRGGRMLSVVDLLEAGTFQISDLCWLLERIELGASWLVGARPGGAGKTTIMSALLAMLPEGEKVYLTESGAGWEDAPAGSCIVCYEISPGEYEGYIWGSAVRRFAACGGRGCRLVANLHADTVDEAHAQIVTQCGVPPRDFRGFGIFIPIRLSAGTGGRRHVVPNLFHFADSQWKPVPDPSPSPRQTANRLFLEDCCARGLRQVAEVRTAWLHAKPKRGMVQIRVTVL